MTIVFCNQATDQLINYFLRYNATLMVKSPDKHNGTHGMNGSTHTSFPGSLQQQSEGLHNEELSFPLLPEGDLPELVNENKPPLEWIPFLAKEHVKQFGTGFWMDEDRVVWEQKEQDFQELLKVKAIIDEDLSDDEFEQRIGEIEVTLLSTYLFRRLNDPDILVTKLHEGTTPFAHTINVLRKLRTDGLSHEAVRAARWSAIWHDVGKIWGAIIPAGIFHSYISALISSEFLFRYGHDLSDELIAQTQFNIYYHHTPEGYGKRIFDEEAQNRLRNKEAAIAFYLLVVADVTSIENFDPQYIVNINSILQKFNLEAYQELQRLGLLMVMEEQPAAVVRQPV